MKGSHRNQFVFIDRFSIKSTFSRTFTEDGRMGHLTTGVNGRQVKTPDRWWRVQFPKTGVMDLSPNLETCHCYPFEKILSRLRV